MPMPLRSSLRDGSEFLEAMNVWMAKDENAYQFLRGLFDATPECTELPEWTREQPIKWVEIDHKPTSDEIDVALRMLASCIHAEDMKPGRICHRHKLGGWSVCAEI